MHDVFISYSHKDAQVADAICHNLEEAGIRCWYAPRNIAPGAEWADAIIEALEACSIVVLVFTDFSNASRQVQREVDTAVSLGKTIIPFKRTQADPTGSMRYYLSTLHWLDAVDAPLDSSIQELVGRARAILDYEKSGGQQSDVDGETGQSVPDEAAGETDTCEREELPSEAARDAAKPSTARSGTQDTPAAGKNRTPLIAAIAAIALACVIGFGIFGAGKGTTSTDDTIAAQDVTTEADSSQSATDGKDGETGDSNATGSAGEKKDETSSSSEATEAKTVTPLPSDAGAEEIYLYTVQSDNTIRLDRYFGPEEATMVLPTTIEGLPVTNVGQKCFEDCEYIQKLVLPETMEIIQYRAFAGCKNLREMNIPASLKKLLGWSFAHTSLVSVTFPDTFTDLDYGVFYGCNSLESVVLPANVDHLGENTFRMCGKLKSVTLPAEQIEINANAFEPNTDVTLIGVAGSYTEKYAKGMGLGFQAI